jgi:hypothetical protein
MYAYQDGAGWHIEAVISEDELGYDTALALDSSNHPHISYAGGGDLRYAYRDEAGWHTGTVDGDGTVGEFSSLALDRYGSPHISYFDETGVDLKYAHWDLELRFVYVPTVLKERAEP